jgi:hypothetical protein
MQPMAILSLGGTFPDRPSAREGTIMGNPAAPMAATEARLRKSRRLVPRVVFTASLPGDCCRYRSNAASKAIEDGAKSILRT